MTIALDPQSRVITQLRGQLNLTAKGIRQGKGGVDDVYASLVHRGRAFLQRWMQENGIGQRDLH
jgi:hypothetical protein